MTAPNAEVVNAEGNYFEVLQQSYEIHVSDHFVIRGSTAILQCQSPPAIRPFIKVMLWLREDGVSIGSPGTIDRPCSCRVEGSATLELVCGKKRDTLHKSVA
ncbi:hypothetical protein TNCV_4981951 [Trichonephila clavipes]|nr:hypothetical protein TNCV_4981951 [Trichonephila clavipes]